MGSIGQGGDHYTPNPGFHTDDWRFLIELAPQVGLDEILGFTLVPGVELKGDMDEVSEPYRVQIQPRHDSSTGELRPGFFLLASPGDVEEHITSVVVSREELESILRKNAEIAGRSEQIPPGFPDTLRKGREQPPPSI